MTKWKHAVEWIRTDRAGRRLWISSAVITAGLWAGMFWLTQQTGTFVPLHYTIYFGIDLTATGWTAYQLPLIATASLIIHAAAAGLAPHEVWRRSWLTLGLVVQLLWASALLAILYIARPA